MLDALVPFTLTATGNVALASGASSTILAASNSFRYLIGFGVVGATSVIEVQTAAAKPLVRMITTATQTVWFLPGLPLIVGAPPNNQLVLKNVGTGNDASLDWSLMFADAAGGILSNLRLETNFNL